MEMKGFEKVMAQNWCEQFIANAFALHPEWQDDRDCGMADFFNCDSAPTVIGEAFSWQLTSQGFVSWARRSMDIGLEQITR